MPDLAHDHEFCEDAHLDMNTEGVKMKISDASAERDAGLAGQIGGCGCRFGRGHACGDGSV